MSQFMAVLVDALRLLRAKALFWVTLGISALAALIYLSIGFDEKGITMMFGLFDFENALIRAGSPFAELFYLGIFSMVIVNIWLSWVAVVLALVTCAPVFPDFMAEGSAGAVLCKPISRLRLFLYKYLCGLLFALLQTTVFCVIVFLAIRWRVGTWNPTVFWAVPLIVLMFSYLWSVMVVVGVRTRSVMAAVLATMLVWLGAWLAKTAEEYAWAGAELGEIPTAAGPLPLSVEDQQRWKERYPAMAMSYKLLPKTSDTVNLLQRQIKLEGSREFSLSELLDGISGGGGERDEKIDEGMKRHSPGLIIGSSLAFEGLMIGIAAWFFCRRDF